ncbi:MAG: flagellar biosynthesis protein FlhB [Planctomycetota bacterium]
MACWKQDVSYGTGGVAEYDGGSMPKEAPGGGEKTEEPTPKKMNDARNEGQVAMSQEVNSTVLLLAGFCALFLFGPWFYSDLAASLERAMVEDLTWDGRLPSLARLFAVHFGGPGSTLLAFSLFTGLLGFAVVVTQVGLRLTLKPLQPKPSKLNPLTGLQRLFGLRGLVKFLVNLAKLLVVIAVATWFLAGEIPQQIVFKPDLTERFADTAFMILLFGIILTALLVVIAAADMAYQRWQHHQELKMTKQEVKEEHRQSEGDPLVKSKIRQIQRKMAQQRMMQEVPTADVVITNPTHVAVALRYDQQEMAAPVCVAKGYDLVAQRIKRIAGEHDVIQVENVDLARALAKRVEVGQDIPVEFFKQVAEILTYVYRLQGKMPA